MGNNASQSGFTGRKSWRGGSGSSRAANAETATRLKSARWLFTVLAVLLVGVLFWYLLRPPSKTYLVILSVWDQDQTQLLLPPLPFVAEDVELLGNLSQQQPYLKTQRRDQTKTSFDAWLTLLKNNAADYGPRDRLIVYFSGQGIVASDNKAYLLTKPYLDKRDLDDFKAGTAFEQVLDVIRSSKAELKLLLLDCDPLANDPRLGVFVDRFPQQLRKEVEAINDPALWVMFSGRPLEPRTMLPDAQQSVFAHFVAAALEGDADADQNREITLGEFYSFICSNVRNLLKVSGGSLQTPWMFHAAKATDKADVRRKAPDQIGLLRVVARSAPPPDSEQVEGARNTNKKAEPTETTASPALRLTLVSAAQKQEADSPNSKQNKEKTSPNSADSGGVATKTNNPQSASESKESNEKPADEKSAAEPKEPNGAKQATSQGDSATKPDAELETAGEGATKSPIKPKGTLGDSSEAAESKPSDEKLSERGAQLQRLSGLLTSIWELRDKLEDQGAKSPIVFAPHLWREVNYQLVELETKARGGKAFNAGTSQKVGEIEIRLRDLKADFESLDRMIVLNQEVTTLSSKASFLRRLAEAWKLYRGSDEFLKFSQELPAAASNKDLTGIDWPRVKQIVLKEARIRYLIGDYVKLCGIDPGNANLRRSEFALNSEDVEELFDELQNFNRKTSGMVDKDVNEPRYKLLVDLFGRVEDKQKGIESELRTRIDKAISQDGVLGAWQADRLLHSACLRANDRKKLWNRFITAKTKANSVPEKRSPISWSDEDALSLTDPQRKWLMQRISLELKRLGTDDDTPLRKMVAQEKDLREKLQPNQGNALLGETLAEFEQELQRYHRTRLDAFQSLSSEGKRSQAYAQAMLIDARDLDENKLRNPTRGFLQLSLLPPRPIDDLRLTLIGADGSALRLDDGVVPVDLELNDAKRIRIQVEPQIDDTSLPLTWKLQGADKKKVAIRKAGATQTLQGGDRFHSSPADRPETVELDFQAVEETGGVTEARIVVSVGDVEQSIALRLTLPLPNRIDLRVDAPAWRDLVQEKRIETATGTMPEQGFTIRLIPGGRNNDISFTLQNRSKQEKQVTVQLYQLPAVPGAPWAPWHVLRGARVLKPIRDRMERAAADGFRGMKLVAQTDPAAPVSLPELESPVRLDLKSIAAETPAPPAPAGGTAPATSPAPAAAPEVSLDNGLLLVITNAKKPNERWLKWLEFDVLNPKNYAAIESKYDRNQKQVSIAVRLSDRDGDGVLDGPPDLAEKKINVLWDSRLPYERTEGGRSRGVLSAEQPSIRLFRDLSEETTRVRVPITIDGYPRAAIHQLDRDRSSDGEDIADRIDSPQIAIGQIELLNELRIFLPLDATLVPPDYTDEESKIQYSFVAKDKSIAIKPVASGDRKLRVRVQADVPPNRFAPNDGQVDSTDVVEVAVRNLLERGGSEPESLKAHADRKRTVRLQRVAGSLAVTAEVADLTFDVPISDMKNVELEIEARLRLADDIRKPHRVRMLIDGEPPRIELPSNKRTRFAVSKDNKILVKARCVDRHAGATGVKQVAAFLYEVGKEKGPLASDAKPLVMSEPGKIVSDDWYEATLDASSVDKAGKYRIRVRAEDVVGQSATEDYDVELVSGPVATDFIFKPSEAKEAIKDKDAKK